MATLIYSPVVEVHIQTEDGTVYDVSQDIVQGSLTRVVNGVSQFQVTLQNGGRKYDGVFAEMDKVAIYLTRIRRLLVLTGYLDMVPIFSAFPADVVIQGSCTLKRLQYWYWDPTSVPAVTLLNDSPELNDRFDLTDGGLALKTVKLLNAVAGWPTTQIHIGAIPLDWFKKIQKVAQQIIQEAAQNALIATVGATGVLAGSHPATNSSLTKPGVGKGTGTLPNFAGVFNLYDSSQDHSADPKSKTPSGDFFCTMRWPYLVPANPTSGFNDYKPADGVDVNKARKWWMGQKILIVNPKNNKAVVVQAVGWGPKEPKVGGGTGLIGSTSDKALKMLGSKKGTKLDVHVAFADDSAKLGQAKSNADPAQAKGLADSNSGTGAGGTGGSGGGAPGSNPGGKGGTACQFADAAAKAALSGKVSYVWGGRVKGSHPLPFGVDCSGLVMYATDKVVGHSFGADSRSQGAGVKKIPLSECKKTKGALVFLSHNGQPSGDHHVGISMGDGTTAEARTQGEVGTYSWASQNWSFGGLIPSLDYKGAGGTGKGGQPGKYAPGAPGGPVVGGGSGNDGGSSSSQDIPAGVVQSLFNIWQWTGPQDFGGQLLGGIRALMNDIPLLQTVDDLMSAGMRQYCSAPNGDFIAWFPDYFGWWGTCAKMVIADVEIVEGFAVAKSDTNLKTHWYVTGSSFGSSNGGDATQIYQEYSTAGIATVEFPELMKSLFHVGTEFDDDGKAFLFRHGARPVFEAMNSITGHRQEFFFACFRFMLNWSSMWTATLNLTFMPELYPGMLVMLPTYGVQAYVQEVRHDWNLTANQGFTTTINCIAWSTIGPTVKGFEGLPVGATIDGPDIDNGPPAPNPKPPKDKKKDPKHPKDPKGKDPKGPKLPLPPIKVPQF